MRLNRSFGCKVVHFLPIIPVYMIVFTVMFSFTYFYAFDCFQVLLKIPVCLTFYFMAVMTIICHLVAMYTDPGTVIKNSDIKYDDSNIIRGFNEKELESFREIEQDFEQNKITAELKLKLKHPLICFKCNSKRPERSHHCKHCNKCVLKMDHHCPWIANCVGFNNQKSFLLFLLYATFGDALAFVCLLPCAYTSVYNLIYNPQVFTHGVRIFYQDSLFIQFIKVFWKPFTAFIGCLLGLAMAVAIGILFYQQLENLVLNTTGIEHHEYSDINNSPWHKLNSTRINIRSVLGFGPRWKWFFPIFKPNKINNGISYQAYVKVDKDKKE